MAGSLVDLSGANDGGEALSLGAGATPDAGAIPDAPSAIPEEGAMGVSGDAGAGASPHGEILKTALSTVQDALNYGRQKYGLSPASGHDPEPGNYAPYEGMRRSTNIEDRRGDTAPPTEDRQTKFDDVVDGVKDRVSEYHAKSNPLSQAAGFSDVASARGAIPDEGENE